MHCRERNRFGTPGLRLVQLYFRLATSGKPYSLTRLATMMSCSRQTILRMMEQIGMMPEVECETWRDKNERFYQIAQSSQQPNILFDADTLRHLALCRDIVARLLPDAVREDLCKTLSAAAADGAAPPACAEPWVKGHIDYTPYQTILESAQQAMAARRLCRVQYNPRTSGAPARLLIAPLLIVAYREALYLRCQLYHAPRQPAGQYRTLAIHRIKSFHQEEAHFDAAAQEDQDPSFGFPFHAPMRVTVAFRRGAASYVAERTWSPDQRIRKHKDGSLRLTFTSTSRLEVISWVLSFGPDAELLEPKDLREEIKTRTKEMAARYDNGPDKGRRRKRP